MEMVIKLRPIDVCKNYPVAIKDEVITGIITGEFYVLCERNEGFYTVASLDSIVSLYKFPRSETRMLPFLSGANPKLFKAISYYEQ